MKETRVENKKEIKWECPICSTCFDKNGIAGLINKFEIMLEKATPTPITDYPGMEYKYFELRSMIHDLKSIHKQYIRKPTNMMASQNAIGESSNDPR